LDQDTAKRRGPTRAVEPFMKKKKKKKKKKRRRRRRLRNQTC
jgi:hypothetical protein